MVSLVAYSLWNMQMYIPLPNGVGGYCKLRLTFSPIYLWPKCEARRPQIEGEKQGSVIYSTDREMRLVRYLLYLAKTKFYI